MIYKFYNNIMQIISDQSSQDLRQWMKDSGCLLHPSIQIPASFNGIQGIGTRTDLPPRTVIIAIPSRLVITVAKCYNDPELKELFRAGKDLFNYEDDEDAEFNILCVFLMYHKVHIDKSPWKTYLNTIAEPQTATNWSYQQLIGLNKSLVQQIVHVRIQCEKMKEKLCNFLSKRKQFKGLSQNQIINLFNIYYPTVLTRCFGSYFSTACIIPIADLLNHSCQSVDHQLIHLNFQQGIQYHETYTLTKHKLNCQILGLPKPEKQSMPFRLDFLIKNKLIEEDSKKLGEIRRNGIDQKIYQLLSDRLINDQQFSIDMLDFCQENDEEDNDTDEEVQNERNKQMEHIKNVEKEQMELYQQYRVEVEKLGDVQKRIQLENQKQKEKEINKDEKKQEKQQEECNYPNQNSDNSLKTTNQYPNKENSQKNEEIPQNQHKNSKKQAIKFSQKHFIPIQHTQDSPQESQVSQEQEWCLDDSCYFTISTHCPVSAGSQLFNSYGCRTNKFLLVWYGFTYRDNLYDSVTLRLQVNFQADRPKAWDIVLDTYLGGQGLCFKKNENEMVRPQQVSRQFRLKRNKLPLQLMIFLRLLLINYYKGKDSYKIICTLPSSLQFEEQLLKYIKNIIVNIYERYPQDLIEKLKKLLDKEKEAPNRNKIIFKIIYLEQQIAILNSNLESVKHALIVIKRLREMKEFKKQVYADFDISVIRKIKQYLIQLKNNFHYILYEQLQKPEHQTQPSSTTTSPIPN